LGWGKLGERHRNVRLSAKSIEKLFDLNTFVKEGGKIDFDPLSCTVAEADQVYAKQQKAKENFSFSEKGVMSSKNSAGRK